MDSRIGLDYIVENKEYTAKLGSGENFSAFSGFYNILAEKFKFYNF